MSQLLAIMSQELPTTAVFIGMIYFDPTQFNSGLSSGYYILLVIVFIFNIITLRKKPKGVTRMLVLSVL